jgi:hypothetical protein
VSALSQLGSSHPKVIWWDSGVRVVLSFGFADRRRRLACSEKALQRWQRKQRQKSEKIIAKALAFIVGLGFLRTPKAFFDHCSIIIGS